jgi:thiaminase
MVYAKVLRAGTIPQYPKRLQEKSVRVQISSAEALVYLNNELSSAAAAVEKYILQWYATCLKGLGLKDEDFKVPRNAAEVAYGQFLMNHARSENWFDLHIIFLACSWVSKAYICRVCNAPTSYLGLV